MEQKRDSTGLTDCFTKLSKIAEKTFNDMQTLVGVIMPVTTEDRTRYTETQWRIRQRFIKAWKQQPWNEVYPYQLGSVYEIQKKRNAQFVGNGHCSVNGHHSIVFARQRSKLKANTRKNIEAINAV